MKDHRLGDEMPVNRNVKFGDMRASKEQMPSDWEDMTASSVKMSEKWTDMNPSAARTSEKWVDMNAGTPMGNQFHEMKQEGRSDPYSMAPSEGDRTVGMKEMKKEKPDNRVSRATQHSEFGSTREI